MFEFDPVMFSLNAGLFLLVAFCAYLVHKGKLMPFALGMLIVAAVVMGALVGGNLAVGNTSALDENTQLSSGVEFRVLAHLGVDNDGKYRNYVIQGNGYYMRFVSTIDILPDRFIYTKERKLIPLPPEFPSKG